MNLNFCKIFFALGVFSCSPLGNVALADTFPVDTPLCTPPPSTSASRSDALVELNASQDSCGLPTSSFPIEIFSLVKKEVCRLEDGPGRYPVEKCSGGESSGSPSPGPIPGWSVPLGSHLPGFSNPYPNPGSWCATLTGFSGEVSALWGCSGDRNSAPSPKIDPIDPNIGLSNWVLPVAGPTTNAAIDAMLRRFGPDVFTKDYGSGSIYINYLTPPNFMFEMKFGSGESIKIAVSNLRTKYTASVYFIFNESNVPIGTYFTDVYGGNRSSAPAHLRIKIDPLTENLLNTFFYSNRAGIHDYVDSIVKKYGVPRRM